MYDNYDAFSWHDAQQERAEKAWLARCPECCECGRKIEDEECYEFGGDLYCEECMDKHKVYTENHMRG